MFATSSVPQDLNRRAAELPGQYVEITANSEEGGRDSGLLVTREDIFKIKSYERTALALPSNLQSVTQLLGFSKSGIAGLEPADLLATYKKLRGHGLSWADLEEKVKLTSASLYTFSSEFLVTGQRVIDVIEKMDFVKQLTTPIREAVIEDGADLAPKELSDNDKLVKDLGLARLLEMMAASIEAQLAAVTLVKNRTSGFASEITQKLIPEVGQKITLSQKHNLGKKVEELNAEIAELTKDIDQKKQEYNELVKKALDGINFMGPVGLVVLGGIFGAQAEKVRKARNKMIGVRDAKVAEVKVLAPLIEAVGRLAGYLDNLDMSLKDAEVGANNLRDMWLLLHTWVTESLGKLRLIDDSKTLFEFVMEFQLVLLPWNDIKQTSYELNTTFIRAINDWNSGAHA
ncbi:alpha-xenorhabdolysin family binary toxin subunit A [Pseudomonas sp. TE3610]